MANEASDQDEATPNGNGVPPAFGGWNKEVKSRIRTGLGRPKLGSRTPTVAIPPVTSHDSTDDALRGSESQGSGASTKELAADKAAPADVDDGEVTSSDEEGEIHSAFSGDDGGVLINVEGEQTSLHPASKATAVRGSELDGSYSVPNGESSNEADSHEGSLEKNSYRDKDDSEDEDEQDSQDDMSMGDAYSPPPPDKPGSDRSSSYSPAPVVSNSAENPIEILDDDIDTDDPLARYASGNPVSRGSQAAMPTGNPVSAHGTNAPAGNLTLADISTAELQLQLRYYHIGRAPSLIPLSTLVRCPCCAEHGHLSPSCPQQTCSHCGAISSHASTSCPAVGQDAASSGPCSLCACAGHPAFQCESRWRTSAWPPARPLPPLTVKLFCYECGGAAHLGNDCPGRQPGKGMGTSAWSRATIAGGTIPVCSDEGAEQEEGAVGAPGGPGGAGRRKRERERRDREAGDRADDGDLIGNSGNRRAGTGPQKPGRGGGAATAAAAAGSIKISGGLARGRHDLRSGGHHHQAGPSADDANGGGGGGNGGQGPKNSNKKRKKGKTGAAGGGGGGGESYRPMPSAAKRAYTQARR